MKWSLLARIGDDLTTRQRWEIVLWSLWPGIRNRYLKPVEAWLQRRLPTPLLILRLEHRGAQWYRVPTTSAALHVWRHLSVHVLEGDFIRIERGKVIATGLVDDDRLCCEFWYADET